MSRVDQFPNKKPTVPEAILDSVEQADLHRRACRGDRSAQAEVLRQLQDSMFRFCLSQLGDEHVAADATQETALRMLTGWSGFRGHSRLKTWALGIALNVCREQRRRAAKGIARHEDRLLADCAAAGHAPDEAAIYNERVSHLQEILLTLPHRQRAAIVLRYFEQLSIAETAETMGVATGTVKATIWQALRSLRRQVETNIENTVVTIPFFQEAALCVVESY